MNNGPEYHPNKFFLSFYWPSSMGRGYFVTLEEAISLAIEYRDKGIGSNVQSYDDTHAVTTHFSTIHNNK